MSKKGAVLSNWNEAFDKGQARRNALIDLIEVN